MQTYSYSVLVVDGNNRVHTIEGSVQAERGDTLGAVKLAMQDQFLKLTRGNTTYGKPGEGGCKGPYRIEKLEIAIVG